MQITFIIKNKLFFYFLESNYNRGGRHKGSSVRLIDLVRSISISMELDIEL